MIVLRARNIEDGYQQGMQLLRTQGIRGASRNGPVVRAPAPVTTTYERPQERVLLYPLRDANPFFHLLEALWMLAGRQDVAFPSSLVPRMREYSDDGVNLHGAYGWRWRHHFGVDQVERVIRDLAQDAGTRRAVINMWDPRVDSADDSRVRKDLPCNVALNFQVSPRGALEMTVFQRSGDAAWGVHGSNSVHFSMLQEFVAGALGRELGVYTHITVNYHLYPEHMGRLLAAPLATLPELYPAGGVCPLGVTRENRGLWVEEADRVCMPLNTERLLFVARDSFRIPFMRDVAVPLRNAYVYYKANKPGLARDVLGLMVPGDWQNAARAWLGRRKGPGSR